MAKAILRAATKNNLITTGNNKAPLHGVHTAVAAAAAAIAVAAAGAVDLSAPCIYFFSIES